MLTDAEVEDLTAMNTGAKARLDYLNDILAPLSEEVDAAENRYQQRMEIAEPYMEQWRAAGYTENQAEAFGLVLAASAERMAPLFGKSPQEYLEERLAGYFGMTQEEFENLSAGGLDAMRGKGARPESMEQAAMYRSPAENIGEFVEQVRGEVPRSKQSVFVFGNAERPEAGLSGAELEITSDAVRHIGRRHPTFAGWENLEAVIRDGDIYEIPRDKQTQSPGRAFVLADGDRVLVVLGNVKNGKRGNRFAIETAFQGTRKGLDNWLKQKQATPLSQGAGSSPARPSPQTRDVIPEPERNGLTEENLASDAAPGNAQEMAGAQEATPGHQAAGAPDKSEVKYPLAWWIMLEKNLSQNALMDMDMTRVARDTWFLSSDKTKLPVLSPSGMLFDDFREGLSRWRKKYPESPGFKEIEELLDWIEAKNAELGLDPINKYYQTELEQKAKEPVQVSSAALGVPDGSNILEYIKAAKKYHDQLKYESKNGKPVLQPQLGKPIRFSRTGWYKNKTSGADYQKWLLFPYLREIIEKSTLIRSEDTQGRLDGFTKAHWLECEILLDDKPLKAGFTLLEDQNGNLFYNITADITKKEKSQTKLPKAQISGRKGFFQGDESPREEKITPKANGVNLHIFESRPAGRAQGAIRQLEDGRYVVGLFKRKNASTVLHETAHFWLEELRRAAGLETAPEWVREAWAKLEKAYGFEGAALTPESWREVQERFAREFEAYAREGKAPSWELQTAFNRFRNWLTDIYRSIKAILGVHEVSPEVREVFDALLATDEEIAQSRRAVAQGSVMETLGEQVAPDLRDKYARAVQKAHENASAVIANRRLVDRRKAERDFREKATAAIDASETYKLIARLREQGIPFDALKGAISEDLAYRLREKWRRARGEGRALIRKGGTLDILDVAAQFNEDTAQGLASVLLDTPTRSEAIDAQVEAELAEWDAAYDAEVEYSSAYDEVLALEMEALTGERQISPAALRRQMEERIDARKMSQVDAEYRALKARLRSEERSTRRAAREAKWESDAAWRERMAELKEKERLRRAALGAAYRARLERDAIVRQLRKVGESKSVPYDYMCQIRRLLGRFEGLGTPGQRLDPATLRGLPTLQEFVTGITGPFGEILTAPEWLLGEKAGRFSDLTLEEMRDVKRLIMELAHAGRTEGKMLADAEKRATREVADDCAASMGKLSQRSFIFERAGLLDTVRGALRKGLSSITSMRFLARWMDGFAQGGVNQKSWFMPLQQALSDELILKREMEQLLRAAVTPLLKVGKLTEAFAIDGVPLQEDVQRLWKGLWDMDKVYSVALNMGNAGNLKALRCLGQDAAGIIPVGMEVIFQSPTANTRDIPGELVTRCEQGMSKAILGGTLTSQADGKTSTNALGEIHEQVRRDILSADTRQIAATLTEQLLRPLAMLNLGITDRRALPWWQFDTQDAADLSLYADALPKLAPYMRISRRFVHERLKLPEAVSEDDVFQSTATLPEEGNVAPPPEAATDGGLPRKRSAATAAPVASEGECRTGRAAEPYGVGATEALGSMHAEAALTAAGESLLRPLLDELANGLSPEELQGRLAELYPRMDAGELADILARAMFVAEIWGRVSANG